MSSHTQKRFEEMATEPVSVCERINSLYQAFTTPQASYLGPAVEELLSHTKVGLGVQRWCRRGKKYIFIIK